MLIIKGFDRKAFTIALVALISPILMPLPGSALQRMYTPRPVMAKHVISNNIVEKLQKEGNFRILVQALRETGLAYPLETERGPYTLFAPNDRAFSSLSKDSFTKLFQDKTRLRNILKYHIVPRRVETADIKFDSLRTLSGDFLMTNVSPAKTITVAGAVVNKADITCRNGVIHSIDTIMFPLTGMENLAMAKTAGGGK